MSDSGRDCGPRCRHCGKPFDKHDGTETLCAKLETAKDAIKILLQEMTLPDNNDKIIHAKKVLGL